MSQELRDQIVDEVCVGATPRRSLAPARSPALGNLADQLQTIGVAAQDVLQACCAVVVAAGAQAWLRQPRVAAVPGLDLQLCRRLGAVPLQGAGARLCMVFHDPEARRHSHTLGLPPHHAYLALSSDLARARAMCPKPPPTAFRRRW